MTHPFRSAVIVVVVACAGLAGAPTPTDIMRDKPQLLKPNTPLPPWVEQWWRWGRPKKPKPVAGGDITAASCSRADVNTMFGQITTAGAGQTGVIPACAGESWTTAGLTWTAPANTTIRGAGSLSTLGGGDATNIVDNSASGSPLLTITIASTGTFRWAGITMKGGSGLVKENGVLVLVGPGAVRVDHARFDPSTYSPAFSGKPIWFGDRVYGVMDHSIMNLNDNSAPYVGNGAGTDGQGNAAWAAATGFGGADFMFFEDNSYVGTITLPCRIADVFSAGRSVYRFNTIQGCSGIEHHATGHAGDDRGARATEGYGNHYTVLPDQSPGTGPPFEMADCSSGACLYWGNTADTDALKNGFGFNVTRKNDATYPQSATPTGLGYCGTAFNGTGSNWDGNTPSAALGYPCLDQPGRGIGDLLTGSLPTKVNDTTGTIAWPNQALEPIYLWKNIVAPATGWGGSYYADNSGGRVVANRDYYPQASGIQTTSSSPFDGTVGTGWGTIANRPSTCTTGVGYFATDEGSWNTSSSNPQGVDFAGADGLLYTCTATNTWTLYYTPYTYPHPLVTP